MIPLRSNRNFILWLTCLFLTGGIFFFAPLAKAQVQFQLTHEVSAKVTVRGNDYVKARKKAVSQAFQQALEQGLRSWIGDEKFDADRKSFNRLLNQADHYVQSYRFIDAVDDPIEKTSAVALEVTLFPDALGKSLSRIGVVAGPENLKNVVILISETSITSGDSELFWDTVPISETSLVQSFNEAGVNVIPREAIRNVVPEETVLSGVGGDMRDAVQIGLKMGADIVILGNAVSNAVKSRPDTEKSTIQTNLSVRVVSALKSTMVAAKSDFATAQSDDLLAGELEAFGEVSRKISDFLLSSLNFYWEAKASPEQQVPYETPQPSAPALPLGDL